MKISTDNYQIATLNEEEQALAIIRKAESAIAELTGHTVTLIAYEQSEETQ